MVVTEFGVGDAALGIDQHLLVERRTEGLGYATLDLAAALHGIGDDARVCRLYAPENLDLTGAGVHGDAKTLHVEADGSRRSLGIAVRHERTTRLARELGELGKRHSPHAADDEFTLERASPGVAKPSVGGGRLQLGRKLYRGGLRRLAGNERARAAIGAGIMAAMGRVGLAQADPVDGGRENRRGDLPVHGAGAVAELGGADGEIEAAIVVERDHRVGDMAGGRHGVDHGQRDAVAGQPFRRQFRLWLIELHRALDEVDALVEPVGAVEHVVIVGRRRRQHGIAVPDDVAAAHLIGADAELLGQLVDCGFHRDHGLRQAIAAKRTRGHRIGVDDEAVDPLIRAVVNGNGLRHRVEHHGGAVIAIGAGVGKHVELQRGEPAVSVGAGLDVDPHRMPRRGRGELLLAGELELDRPTGLQRGQRQNVLNEHLLLPAKTAADALAEHADLVQGKLEHVRERAPGQERHLRRGADVEDTCIIEPGEATMGLQRRMLHTVTVEGGLVSDSRRSKRCCDVAELAMRFRNEIALRVRNAVRAGPIGMNERSARRHRLFGIDQRRQDLVVDLQPSASLLGSAFTLGDHGCDLLADEAHDVIEDAGVLGVHPVLLVPCRREQHRGRILMRQDRVHAGYGHRRRSVDRDDPGMRMRRAQQLDVQQAVDLRVERVARRAADDVRARGRRQAAAEGIAGLDACLDIGLAVDRILDRAIAGAAADISLQRSAEVGALRLVQRGAGHDHAGGAEAALKSLRVQEGLLHRVRAVFAAKTFDRRDRVPLCAKRRDQATMHRLAVEQHGAGAAVAGVTAFFHPEMAKLAQERAQALADARRLRKIRAIDLEAHGGVAPRSSARISSASRSVMCLRQSGLP
ncbi:hypothetical protein ACVWYH_007014 [Bradyrhizobium sp. GM24.11]